MHIFKTFILVGRFPMAVMFANEPQKLSQVYSITKIT